MRKNKLWKIPAKNFFNVARTLPRYSVSSFLENSRKGVST